MSEVDDLKKKLRAKKPSQPDPYKEGLSIGSTLLNLACSDRPNVGFLKGHYYYLVGDSASGKTFLSLTCLAEATRNAHFNDYQFIYDNTEAGALMNFKRFFGTTMAERVSPPGGTREHPKYSTTLEDFYFNVDDAANRGPFIYVLDSMDALTSTDDEKKFKENKRAQARKSQGGEDQVSGSYGTSKAKLNSSHMRIAHNRVVDTGSILIVVSQTRDNVGAFCFEKKTRGGGHALNFYATLAIWSSVKEKIKKRVREKDRQVGVVCRCQVKKNRLTGKERSVLLPIYYTHGFDDTGSLINYLVEENHWKGTRSRVVAPEFDFDGPREILVDKIEEENRDEELRLLVAGVWQEIEAACAVRRRKRYD